MSVPAFSSPKVRTCPLCNCESEFRFAADSIAIADCRQCRHRFADFTPRPDHVSVVYGDEYFHGGGAGYSDYLSEARLLDARGRWYAKKIRRLVPVGRMIDVGAAAGLFLRGFLKSGWNGEGVEPNERMANTARDRFKMPVVHSSWEDYRPTAAVDLVTMVQVLPHFVDPARALAKAAETVRAGGGVLVETWNSESLTARMFGRGWHEYSPPTVLHWFSPARLASFAKSLGLQEVARGRPSKWIEAGHAKSLLEYKLNGSLPGRMMKALASFVPDRLALPYPAEDLFWMFLRKRA